MRGFYMDEAFTGSPSDLQHISHDTNFTAKQWVDNTSASLAPIEATSTASQPYTVGKRLVYGGRLYKVTQAIAQGGTLTPGTNITPDTVDEELSTISTQLTWVEIGRETGTTPITFEANRYHEFNVFVRVYALGGGVTFNFPAARLGETFFSQAIGTPIAGGVCGADITTTSTSIAIAHAYTNGNETTTQATIIVYGR